LLVAVGLYFMLADYARRASDRAYDQLLLASALTVADAVQVMDGRITADLPYASLAILGAGGRNRVFYRITAPDGTLVTGYPGLADRLPPARSQEPRFVDILYQDVQLRAVTLGHFIAFEQAGSWITIVIAQTRDESSALAAEILTNAFLPVMLIVVAAGGLIWFGIRRALASLAMIERTIGTREPTDLSPLTLPVPVEVQQLLATLNHFMHRLRANLDLMQAFLADAAHQIRTPLAALRAQAELAVDEDDATTLRSYIHKIHRNAAFASQVTNQILSHTMVAHRSQHTPRQAVDLVPLLHQVAHHVEMGGSGPPIELDLRELEAPATIAGDAISLREAFTNLLDNSRKYAGDQYPVQIRVRRKIGDRRLMVDVADRGPGIADAEKGRVIGRFVRGQMNGQQVTGSGLGLAIVKAVADAHGATMSLLDRPGGGLVVHLDFPVPLVEKGRARASTMASLAVPLLSAAVISLASLSVLGAETLFYPAPAREQGRLLLHAATDHEAMEPLLRDFQTVSPGSAIDYRDLSTNELYASVVAPTDGVVPDLAISSAMDLQVKLVNDGWTQPHVSKQTSRLPGWANWRNEAFGFTLEPAVIVYRQGSLGPAEMPRARDDLVRLLQSKPVQLRGRVATYDITQSGVGYLFATQDAVLSSQFWRLALAFGEVGTRLVPNSADILSAIESGRVLIGYNVLGSYARARQLAGAPIEIVLPTDYTLIMARVAVIPKGARHLALATAFLDYLLSPRGQATVAGIPGFQAVTAMNEGRDEAGWPLAEMRGPFHAIALRPQLLVYLDSLKKSRLLENWNVMVHPP
jgi:two-component system sensor histidine kinase TctE